MSHNRAGAAVAVEGGRIGVTGWSLDLDTKEDS